MQIPTDSRSLARLRRSALANWWIVRAADETCLVVDIEPTGTEKGVTKLGKDSYETSAQAEADVKLLCKEQTRNQRASQEAQSDFAGVALEASGDPGVIEHATLRLGI